MLGQLSVHHSLYDYNFLVGGASCQVGRCVKQTRSSFLFLVSVNVTAVDTLAQRSGLNTFAFSMRLLVPVVILSEFREHYIVSLCGCTFPIPSGNAAGSSFHSSSPTHDCPFVFETIATLVNTQ